MEKSYILGVDLGTSSLKAMVYDENLDVVAEEKQGYPAAGGEVTAGDWWSAFLSVLGKISGILSLKSIACVSLSGYNAFVGVNKEGMPVTPVIPYFESAPVRHTANTMDQEAAGFVFSRTGNRLLASGMMANAVRWLKNTSPYYDRADCFLFSNGFLAAGLTGCFSVDAPRASVSLLHDPKSKDLIWDEELCRLFGVAKEKLPDIVWPWEPVGTISRKAARETGLSQGIFVMAGAMDSMCAALGGGVISPGQVLDIGGSAGGLAAVTGTPSARERLYLVRFSLPERWCSIGPLDASARLFPWFVEQFAPGWSLNDYFEKVREVPALSGGAQFLPYVGSARHPYWRAGTFGHFMNISPNTTIAHLARSVMEGLSCAYRRILEDLCTGGENPSEIIAAGGDNKSLEWVEAKANMMGISYRVSESLERSALGCAILGAMQLGLIRDVEAFTKAKRGQEKSRLVLPKGDMAPEYERYYREFTGHCEALYGRER